MPNQLPLPVKERDVAPLFSAQAGGGPTRLHSFTHSPIHSFRLHPLFSAQACQFRDQFEDFQKCGLVVLGVSADSAASHDKFARRFRLPFILLADEDKAIARAYGAWGEKRFLGRKYMGMRRITDRVRTGGFSGRVSRRSLVSS